MEDYHDESDGDQKPTGWKDAIASGEWLGTDPARRPARPPSDPMIRALRKAYRESPQYELDQLLAEETRWKRKATIAQNKLTEVRNKINAFAQKVIEIETTDPKSATKGTPDETNPAV